MNGNHPAAVAVHAPIRNDIANNDQPVRARIGHCVPGALRDAASSWPAVFIYWLVKVGLLAMLARNRDTIRLGSVKPIDLMVFLCNYGRGSTLHIKELFDGRSDPAIHCGCM